MASSGEPCDDDHRQKEPEQQGSSALDLFLKAAEKVAKVEHESAPNRVASPIICDLRDIAVSTPVQSSLRLIKEEKKMPPSAILSFGAKERSERVSKKIKKGIK